MEVNANPASFMSTIPPSKHDPIEVTPHATETVLSVALIVVGILLWIVLAVSLIGIFYGVFFGIIFFFAHLTLIANIRGNSVKLSQRQMPDLYSRVEKLSQRIGLKNVPDVYLLQSGGVLNAFATRFGSRNFIVLYSDIVKSCGTNNDALDFIIGHELGHLHRGHLRWRWLKAPAHFIPFLGSAYSRACEYTCDSYGKFSCTDPKKVPDSLCILACGATFAPMINRQEFVEQSKDLNSVFMKLGTWLMSHPPLVKRVAAIDPGLKPEKTESEMMATVGALLIAALLFFTPVIGGGWFMVKVIHGFTQSVANMNPMSMPATDDFEMPSGPDSSPQSMPLDDEAIKPSTETPPAQNKELDEKEETTIPNEAPAPVQ